MKFRWYNGRQLLCSGEGGPVISSQKIFPYVSGFPLLGNVSDIMRDRLGFLQRMARVGDVCGFRLGPFPGILFNKPEYVQSILVEHTSDFDKGVELIDHCLPPMVREGLLCREGEQHRCQRKRIAPVFPPRHLAKYADCMAVYSERLQQTWQDGETIDINKEMSSLTMSILGKMLFDAEMFSESDELGAAIMESFDYLSHVTSALYSLPYHWPTPRNLRLRRALLTLRTRLQCLIDERRAHPSTRDDFLSLLLRAKDEDGASISDNQLMAECFHLFGAGYETTATALSWAWTLLCQHPESYQRVQREVDSVLQGRTPTYADLERLPYCLQVLKEALRLYPPIYLICRRALHAIDIDGYHVPKGCMVFLAAYTLHRRAEYFSDPETFDPERFTPEQEKRRPRYSFVPFGAGPRVCIGLHFALLEAHLSLATLAQRTSFAFVPNQVIEIKQRYSLLLRPAGVVRMVVTKRPVGLARKPYQWPCEAYPPAEVL